MAQYTAADFASLALDAVPEIREDLEDYPELVHLQVAALARVMQAAKGAADWATYDRGVRLADGVWDGADPALKNALYVSLLEHLDFEGPRGPAAWARLTPRLQAGWREIMAYLESLREEHRRRPLYPQADV